MVFHERGSIATSLKEHVEVLEKMYFTCAIRVNIDKLKLKT